MLFGLDLNDFSTGISAIITGSLLFTLLHYALSKQVKEEDLNHDAIGGYFGVIGTLYAVLIGLVIYDATSKYTSASNNISSESKAIGETHLYAKQFKSGNISSEISSLLINYIDEIVRSDWQHLAEDKNNPKAREFLSQIMLKIESIEPKTTKEEMYLPILLQSATNMAESRMVRFDNTTHSLPSCEWVLLSFSASLTLLTSLFLRVGKITLLNYWSEGYIVMWRSPLSMGFEGLLSSLKSRISAKDGGIIDKVTVKFRSCPCGLVDANGIKKPAKS